MPTVFSDPSTTLYVILAIVVGFLGVIAFRTRRRNDFIRLGVAAAALFALFLIDRIVESPREETTRKMQEIALATRAKDLDAAFKNIADAFQYQQMNKKQFRDKADVIQSLDYSQGIQVSGFHRADFEKIDNDKVKVGFDVGPAGGAAVKQEYQFYCWGTFQREPDGQFRLSTFDLYKSRPNHPSDKPILLPQLQ